MGMVRRGGNTKFVGEACWNGLSEEELLSGIDIEKREAGGTKTREGIYGERKVEVQQPGTER